jgi:hypothetical protein
VLFRIVLSDLAQWMLDQVPVEDALQIRGCLEQLARNPYRDLDQRVTLVWPLGRPYHDAYRCGNWAIAYEFRDDDTLLIEAISDFFY